MPTPRAVLLRHVPLPGAVLGDGLVVALHRGIEVPDRVPASLADLVADLEAVDFAGVAHELPVVVRAARLRERRRLDAPRVVVVRLLGVRVADDAPQVAVRLLVRGPQIASDSLHHVYALNPAGAWRSSSRAVKSRYLVSQGAPSAYQ